jgi:PDZ domain-containing protein
MTAEIDEKIGRLVRWMEERRLGGVLLSTRANFAWITAGHDNHIANNTEAGVAAILATPGERVCLANTIEAPRMEREELAGTGIDVVAVESGLPVNEQLVAGDVIVGIDGEPVTVTDELIDRVRAHRPGDTVTLEVERGGGTEEVSVTLSPRPDNPDAPMIGVSIQTRELGFDLPFEVEVDTGEVGGPSAGLAISLAVLDRLTPGSITGGRKVAVTGEIFSSGEVGIVGGVAQKTVAVKRAGAKLFIVPSAEFAIAKARGGRSLRVEKADTLDEALHVLATLRGSNALALAGPGGTGTRG